MKNLSKQRVGPMAPRVLTPTSQPNWSPNYNPPSPEVVVYYDVSPDPSPRPDTGPLDELYDLISTINICQHPNTESETLLMG